MDQVIRMDNKLIEELHRVNRKSLDNLEKFHAVYEKLLHPSHAFLMQLKQWLFEGRYDNNETTHIISIKLKNFIATYHK